MRDLFAGDFVAAHVDSDRTHKRIVGYLKKTSPHMVERVHRTKEKEPLFERFGVEKEIASTIDRRVDLPSGGYLIFDYAEAFTVIDVNTGRFVGSRSKTSTQRLEDTIVKNNLEAVKEVVRQLRLRDIGGIIVIDFIDMANPKNRQAVEDALRTELERDRTKTYVVEISPLGLVEMTRQNVTDGPREVMTRQLPDLRRRRDRRLGRDRRARGRAQAARARGRRRRLAGPGVQGRGASRGRSRSSPGAGGARLAALEEATRRRFYLVAAKGHVHVDHFEVLAEGRRDDLAPTAPVEEGAELELKLVEIDLHDGTAGVGKLDGLDVVVAGRGEARRQEGEGARRSRARRPGVRDARQRASRRRADHVRERGGEADPRAGAARRPASSRRRRARRRAQREPTTRPRRADEVAAEAEPEADARPRPATDGAADDAAQEAHTPRVARRAGGARSRRAGGGRDRAETATGRSLAEADEAVAEVAAADAESARPASRPRGAASAEDPRSRRQPGRAAGVRGARQTARP